MTTIITEDAVRFTSRSAASPTAKPVGPSPLEVALTIAAHKMRRARIGIPAGDVDLEGLAAQLIEAAIRDEHTFVLCSADNPASPTAEEHRWAVSLAGAVANRFNRIARQVLRKLKAGQPQVDTSRTAAGCPAWCLHRSDTTGCDWHESKPIEFEGPGDMYDENQAPYEALWACLAEVPDDEIAAGAKPGSYIYFDTLSVGQGSRLNVAQTDDLIRRLGAYLGQLQAMRDQLAALTDQEGERA